MSATATRPVEPRPEAGRPAMPVGPGRWRDATAVLAPSALAAVLVLTGLTARSLGFDEAASVSIASQHGHALLRAIGRDGGNMAGYYLLLHVVAGLFGHGLPAIRLPSAVAAVATVAIVGVLGLRLFDRRVALLAGLLSAVSLPLIFWGQSARGYAPMIALAAGSCLSFVSVLERRRWARAAHALTTALAVYASFVALLVVAAQLVTLLRARRSSARRCLPALVAGAVACVPLLVLGVARGSGQLFWVPRPNLTSEKQVLEALTSATLPPSFRPGPTTALIAILTIAIVLLAIFRPGLRERAAEARLGHVLVGAWLVVPLALAWVESLLGQSILLPRNLLASLPAVALLLALGLTHPRLPAHAAWALLAVLIALRAVPLAGAYGTSPENWKAATASVLGRAQAGDCIAFYPGDARMPFAYYLGARAAPRPVLPADAWGPLRPYVEDYATLPAAQIARLPSRCPRLWLVSSHEGRPAGPSGVRANYQRFVGLSRGLARAYPSHSSARFGYAAPISVTLLSRP